MLLLFTCKGVSNSLWPHGLQHAGLPCPTPSPGTCSNLCTLSQWCHPTISSSVVPFSSCPQSLPVSGSFPMSQLFAWGFTSPKYWSFSFSISPSDEYSRLKKRREAKGKGEKERHTHLNAEFQRIARRDTLGRPRGMVWGGWREEGSGWGTHVYLWWIHFDIWQN